MFAPLHFGLVDFGMCGCTACFCCFVNVMNPLRVNKDTGVVRPVNIGNDLKPVNGVVDRPKKKCTHRYVYTEHGILCELCEI